MVKLTHRVPPESGWTLCSRYLSEHSLDNRVNKRTFVTKVVE